MPWNAGSTITDSDKNVMIPVRECVQTIKRPNWLLNFSLCYEWFNFYNPLLFSLHPTSLSKWKSQLIILACPAMMQRSPSGRLQVAVRSPLGDFPCLGCRQITPGSPSGVPTASRRRTADVRAAACGFFPPITPQIPTGRWAEAGRRLGGAPRDADQWVNLCDIGQSSGKF